MRKKGLWLALVLAVFFAWAMSASAFQLEFHGEFGNKIQTTNTLGMIDKAGKKDISITQYTAPGTSTTNFYPVDELGSQDLDDTWAELQFRLWGVASSDDGNIKGVWSMEVGTLRYGESSDGYGLAFENEGKDIEVREMYVDFQLPYFQSENRLSLGLQEVDINEWLLAEIGAGIRNYGSFMVGQTKVDYQIGWLRSDDSIRWDAAYNTNDNDYWFGKVDFELKELLGVDKFDVGLFAVYGNLAQENNQPYWLGAELDFFGFQGVLFDLDLIYLGGDYGDDDYDAWFFHGTAGYQFNEQLKASFTFWYASGDDKPNSGDMEAYQTIMTDTYGSVVLFEDATFDDGWYVSADPYLDNNLGFLMYRFRVDYQATPKLALAAAINYMQFDEDAEYIDNTGRKTSDDSIGWEIDVYADYELYKGLSVNLAAGYLFTDDGMDVYSKAAGEGDADDMYRLSVGVTYSF